MADAHVRAIATILLGVLAAAAAAQNRPPLVDGVDLSVPTAPCAVPIAGRTFLVYELHITNLLPVDVELVRVQVLSSSNPGAPLGDHQGADLARRIGRPGLPPSHDAPRILGAGLRAVVYFWLDISGEPARPTSVRHHIEMIVRRPSSPGATLESAAVEICKQELIELDPPVRGGPWVAIYDPDLKGGHRTAIYAIDGRARIPGRFAIDLVRLSPTGTLEAPGSEPPPNWNGYGSDVLAVADATVAAAMDDIPDTEYSPGSKPLPVPLQNASGNYVALDLGNGRFAFYEHLKHGSITVRRGERVRSGQAIARLGNSGSSSIGPHLHFHVSDTSSPLGAEGLPYVFARFEQLGRFASIAALVDGQQWTSTRDADRVRRREFAPANSVIMFSERER